MVIHALVIAAISMAFTEYNSISRILFMLISNYLLLMINIKSQFYHSLICLLISFSISYISLILVSIPICIIFIPIYESFLCYNLLYLTIGILQFLVILYIFHLNRFKTGIILLIKNKYANIGIYTSLLIIVYIAIESKDVNNATYTSQLKALLSIITFSLFLLYYWNHRITQTYREKLRLANEKSLEDELNNKLIEIETLKADNDRLAKIIHKDNKLVPAMHRTVIDFLESVDKLTPEELSRRGYELSEQLHKIAEDRQGILNEAHSKTNLPPTGIHTVDGVLSYMESRAVKENIAYKLHFDENIKPFILSSVSEEDLCHLLSDLIENAIIATRYSTGDKQIKISLGVLKNHFILEVSDSGKEFDIETYQHFGQEKRTTHAEHGGSGIGLIDIWKIKKQNKISLQIYEYPSDSSAYSKKISFVFDRKNHFLMQTYRYKEIIGTLTRGDLYVFPYESTENI